LQIKFISIKIKYIQAFCKESNFMNEEAMAAMLNDVVRPHVKLYLEDPERGRLWDSTPFGGPGILPCLLLVTRGRKTGKTSILPLIYGEYGDAFVIIASKGGAPAHPAWYLNLEDEPECKIQVASDHHSVRARTAEGEEREELWQMMAEIYPPYLDYQDVAKDRQIPVVVLETVD
jgi:deazaflavin-dependent oxidoreductase (nitroreductase family)